MLWRKSVENTPALLVNMLEEVHNKYIKSTG